MTLSNPSQLVLRSEPRFAGRNVLFIGAPDDRLAAELAAEQVTLWHWHWSHHQFAQQCGWNSHFGISPPQGLFDVALVFMPKAKSRLHVVLQQVCSALPEGALLYLVGEKREGIDSAGKLLQAIGDGAQKIDRARHCVLWEVRVKAGLVAQTIEPHCSTIDVIDATMSVCSLPGVFSDGRLDEGTALLLQHLPELPQGSVLDFACGSGVIGAFILTRQPTLALTAVDCDAFSIASATATFTSNNQQAEVLPSDGLQGVQGRRFASIVTNPPFHDGMRTDMSMSAAFIRSMADHLQAQGELWLVANRFLPYAEALQLAFKTVSVAAETGKFVVYRARLG